MTKFVVLLSFMAAFAAGLVVGFQVRRPTAPPETQPGRRGGWLAKELNLTPAQQEELDRIWSQTARSGGREREERRRQLVRERDQTIAALIRPEDEWMYDEILREYAEQMDELEREWRASFQAAVERTRQILTPEQRARYDDLLQRRQRDREPHDWRRGDRGYEARHRPGRP